MSTIKENNYFDVQNSIIKKTKVTDQEIQKHFSPFMAITTLSLDAKTCWQINSLNAAVGLKFIPKKAEYSFLYNTVKLPRNTFLKNEKSNKNYKLVIKELNKHFKSGTKTTEEYIKILGGVKIMEILDRISQKSNKYCTNPVLIKLRAAIQDIKKELLKIKGIK